ncbi:Uu.00g137570.m01.CDS01 [Anthostomella pinea]|uniref:Uu.00g137570.m01.CDS01 n=1 Tax=Anthostomella pinea TaxID=933095 RepID=A0AAI8YIP9_9PEZI|nr:Uu.00g137570.m01.CDS01 [Anthostomella pinea]
MKQQEDDVESAARLLSKDSAPSNEEFEFDDSDDSHNWSTQHTQTKSKSQHSQYWPTLPPLPKWLPVRHLNPRYIIFAVAVSLIVTVFVFNPYGPSAPTQHQSEIHLSPTSTKPAAADATATSTATSLPPAKPSPTKVQPGKEKYKPYRRPKPASNERFCTNWPVDQDGQYQLDAGERTNRFTQDSIAPRGGWQKPEGLKVVAMVFFGRKRYVDILDCYLRKNLVSNGGYLDEVWFMAHTQDEDDIAWVEGLVLENPDYKIVGQGKCEQEKYKCLWEYAIEDKTIYIKIDDDIIYIHPDAIPQLVHSRIAVPHPFAISANLVNSPLTGMEQYHFGAIHAFVPDPSNKPSGYPAETWRPSEIKTLPPKAWKDLASKDSHAIMYPDAPYRGHPFLLISEDHHDLLQTPIGRYDQDPGGDFIAFSPMWRSWAMAAQQQYSLFHNIEKNLMHRYFFGQPPIYPADAKGPNPKKVLPPNPEGPGGEQIYDPQYRRYNLNFCAVWGSDVKSELPIGDDDEDEMTNKIPKRIGRPFVIDTRSVVAHFSFFTQAENMTQTDLLDRYRAFANEAVCEPTNLKKPWDLMCPDMKKEGGLGIFG